MIREQPIPRYYPRQDIPTPAMPLARYLPPLPPGMVSSWLAENVPPGSWVLDPLGASPALALEAARAGYRVLVASNNPILSFIIETLASAPESADFQSVLAELAMTRRGLEGEARGNKAERLEQHIRRLYETECDNCGETVEAEAFLWRKGEDTPYGRIFKCPKCGESGEKPISPTDLDRLEAMGGDKLQRSRALQRVILSGEEYRADVEEALESYLARPLYVLFTLLNKTEGLSNPPNRQRLLQALLLSAFDAGDSLWAYPGGRARPKQLTTPPQFRENNLWMAIEAAVAEWAHQPTRIQVTHWPTQPIQTKDHPETGGICLFRGRVKALMPLPADIGPRAVLTAFPRPNQAFWTLSVLWAGWLWGNAAALPLRNVLDRRRYDWNWHTSAIHNALAAVGWAVPRDIPFWGILSELAPGFLGAGVVAAEASGFHLQGLTVRPEPDEGGWLAQGTWRPQLTLAGGGGPEVEPGDENELPDPLPDLWYATARDAMRTDLLARSEPAPYLIEYAAGLTALAQRGAIPRRLSSIPGDLLTRVQAVLARSFSDRSFLRLYTSQRSRNAAAQSSDTTPTTPLVPGAGTLPASSGDSAEERGWWWLVSPAERKPASSSDFTLPLSDRVEMEVVRFLQKRQTLALPELDQALCQTFPGLLTPTSELVRACLDSYAEITPAQPGAWRMRPNETAPARKLDLQEIATLLETVGHQLGYQVSERDGVLLWTDPAQEAPWRFYRMASSIISRFVLPEPPDPPGQNVLVLPGSRAKLLGFKLRRDTRLQEAAQGWIFLKFRHLRDLAAQPHLTRETWQSALAQDPLTDEATQMALFV